MVYRACLRNLLSVFVFSYFHFDFEVISALTFSATGHRLETFGVRTCFP